MFEHCGRRRRTTDGRRQTPEHGYTISSPCEPECSGELKNKMTNSPVNAHLINVLTISIKQVLQKFDIVVK